MNHAPGKLWLPTDSNQGPPLAGHVVWGRRRRRRAGATAHLLAALLLGVLLMAGAAVGPASQGAHPSTADSLQQGAR